MTDHMCVGGRFAGEVAGVELFERGVDVVDVEWDERNDPVVCVHFEDVKDIAQERLGSLISTPVAGSTEGEAFSAGRNDGRRDTRDTDVSAHPHTFDDGIPTL
jgi:hypothetical protein